MPDDKSAPLLDNGAAKTKNAGGRLVDGLYIACMCGVAFTSNLLCSLIAPFLPNKFAALNIDVVWVGIVFAVFPCAILASSPPMNALTKSRGRVWVLGLGLLIQGTAAIGFGFGEDIGRFVLQEPKADAAKHSDEGKHAAKHSGNAEEAPTISAACSNLILFLYLFFRTAQGVGAAGCNLAIFSMVGEWPSTYQRA